jgi:hypothetical protein
MTITRYYQGLPYGSRRKAFISAAFRAKEIAFSRLWCSRFRKSVHDFDRKDSWGCSLCGSFSMRATWDD